LRDSGTDEVVMDWALVDKRLRGRLEDVNVLRIGGGIIGSGHFLVVAKMLWGGMRYEKPKEDKIMVFRLSELLKNEKAEKYGKLIKEQWIVVRVRAVVSIGEEWD
jgi:hypothetical protein